MKRERDEMSSSGGASGGASAAAAAQPYGVRGSGRACAIGLTPYLNNRKNMEAEMEVVLECQSLEDPPVLGPARCCCCHGPMALFHTGEWDRLQRDNPGVAISKAIKLHVKSKKELTLLC